MSAIIQVNNLTQTHQNQKIIDDLSFTVEEGDVFGFVGPNGSGKTILIRIMATLLAPTHGDVLIDGYSAKTYPTLIRKVIGYIPDQCGYYTEMTTWEYLDFYGACYKIHNHEREEVIPTLLELADLFEQKDIRVEKLSPGMKQRLSLARALLHDPKVLILDNPLSNLDFYAREEFLELLRELSQLGKTIFFSAHVLSDVARICNRVGIIDAGRLVACGAVQELEKIDEYLSNTTKEIDN